ncbi:hypothetical protein STCU_10187 [Strigomonas culicis]|uniref:Uncharacterized protein n=1 Tax=Strigomonas culicis TaxID=28005 RepID=S9UUC0_9TRYP|nr:hypothetical protein STCU_10187 [Strigomonas culicis]|eukprot:EPY18106.1 hypothetical protein STCU_10187 [Strigomonas culicis]
MQGSSRSCSLLLCYWMATYADTLHTFHRVEDALWQWHEQSEESAAAKEEVSNEPMTTAIIANTSANGYLPQKGEKTSLLSYAGLLSALQYLRPVVHPNICFAVEMLYLYKKTIEEEPTQHHKKER